VKNEIEKVFIHSISENTSKCSTIHVRSMLLKEIIIAILKMHLNEVHFSKNEISQLESESSSETYYTYVINEVEKMSVYNVSENTRKCLAMHVRSILLKAMIITMQKTHLNEIYFSKNKIF